MMKLVVLALSLFLVSMPSQAKRTPAQRVLDSHRLSILKTQIATKNVLAIASSRPFRTLLIINAVIDDREERPPGSDELDLQGPFDRNRSVHRCEESIDDIGAHARVRLAIARARALEKYRENWVS